MKYVVIGASAAGIGALKKLRVLDPASEIICIAAQRTAPYNTCLLAEVLAGARDEQSIMLGTPDFFEKNTIETFFGVRVCAIDPAAQSVTLDTGERVRYDKLFIGTGMTPCVPASLEQEQQRPGVFGFHTLRDTQKILNFITESQPKSAVVIGSGFSGIECADALARRGIAVTIVERQSHVLPAQADDAGAQMLMQHAQKYTVTPCCSEQVVRVVRFLDRVVGVELAGGDTVPCDMVVIATGARPASDIAKSAGLVVQDDRIIIDQYCTTSNTHIFAGGDVCVVRDTCTGELVPSTLWPDAMQQGMHAAYAMVGQPKEYKGIHAVTSSTVFGIRFVSCGPVLSYRRDAASDVVIQREASYLRLLVAEQKLIGFLFVGEGADVGYLRRAVAERIAIVEVAHTLSMSQQGL